MKLYFSIIAVFLISVLNLLQAQDIEIKPDPAKEYQTIEGWGSSLCWWANMVGKWEDEEKIDDIIDLITSPDKLNMNIFRYNIGGGDDPSHYSTDDNPGHMASGKGVRAEMEGFKPGEDEPYDWTADAGQRKIMLKIKEKRPDAIFEAFSNSPPYWMTYSGCSAGNDPASADNLKPEYYGQFCDYLVEVCKHYYETYGIEFKTLEPFNESLSSYWGYLGGQEGCHFDASSQIAVLRELYPKLLASGLNTVISASDETNISSFLYAMDAYVNAEDIVSKLGQINTHTYSGSDPEREEAYDLSRIMNKTLWQSETGPSGFSNSGLSNNLQLVQRMFDDLTIMKPSAWLDWQLMEEANDTWCQMRCSFADETYYTVKNFYVRMQVTRFVKQGYRILESGQTNVLTALSPDNDELIMVVLNQSDEAQTFTTNLSLLGTDSENAEVYRTSSSEDCVQLSNQEIIQGQFSYSAPSQSISTFIIPVSYTDYSQFKILNGITFEDKITEGFSGETIQLKHNENANDLNASPYGLSSENAFIYEPEHIFITTQKYRYLHVMTQTSGSDGAQTTTSGDTILLNVINQWQDQVIDLGINTSFSKLIFKSDDPSGKIIVDNLIINNDPDPRGITEIAPVFDFESASGTPVMNRLPYERNSELTTIENSDIAGLNVSGNVLEYLIPAVSSSTISEDTLILTLTYPLKITGSTFFFHMLVKSPESKIHVSILGISKDIAVTPNEWTDIVINLSDLTNQIIGSLSISSYGSENLGTILYLDDITFNDDSEPRSYVFEAPKNGTYIIYSRNSNNVITATDDGLTQETPVSGYEDPDQLWDFTANDEGYTITNNSSGRAITDQGSYLLALTDLTTDKDGQIYTVSETDGGYVKILSVKTGKAIDVEGESTSSGANIGLWTFGSSDNYHRQWALVKMSNATELHLPQNNNLNTVILRSGNGKLSILNLPDSSDITIYTINGIKIRELQNVSQDIAIDLNPGIYITKIQTNTGIFSLKGIVY